MLEEKDNLSQWFYHTTWKPMPIDLSKTLQSGCWIVSGKKDGFSQMLSKQLESQIGQCLDIELGEVEDKESIKGIVHIVSELKTVLSFLQSLLNLNLPKMPPLYFVTQGTHALEDSSISLWDSPFNGFFKTLLLEYPELRAFQIDLDPSDTPEHNIEILLTEFAQEGQEPQAAYRRGKRFVPRFARLENLKMPSALPYIDPEGSYLITGGLGGLGLKMASGFVIKV